MNMATDNVRTLLEEVSKLELRVKELSEENRDLRDCCDKNGIPCEEFLATRRHSSLPSDSSSSPNSTSACRHVQYTAASGDSSEGQIEQTTNNAPCKTKR